ncbi:8-amino-7-oxononanoate synthase [bacterium BMS3Abin07]|nr:8-amino-7-oxononanoate synthase [bacterium BMS3Abin07]GBE32524.1 8-amino-7-oxononanoate synthase [bacterium BMS3Bbin05]HDZ88075.1 8-amino-7-oxononanoate synthase [Nitrospirota bacterium]
MFENELETLYIQGIRRQIRDRQSGQGRLISLGNDYLLNLASNDYLGFANEEKIINAAIDALRKHGAGAGSSRLLSGGTVLHAELEETAARLKGTESAVVFNSGYSANTGAIPVLAGEKDAIFSDELNHASIIDGCRLSRAKKYIYRHCDISDLRKKVRCSDADRRIVVTDALFSMDGDIAPLRDIYDVCRETSAVLYIDDAHGTGVLGNGRGTLVHYGLEPSDFVIQMCTLSKSFGSYGAFVAADKGTVDYLINRSRSLIFSTALPPAVIASAKAAIELIMSDHGRADLLNSNVNKFHKGLEAIRVNKANSSTQIIPLLFESVDAASDLSAFLEMHKIYAPVIKPPTVKQPRTRISLTAMHTGDDIDMLLGVLSDYFGKK